MTTMKQVIPTELTELSTAFALHNVSLYVVGGAVRDFFLGIYPKDWDIATTITPDKVIEICKSESIKFVDKDFKFGVIRAYINGMEFEIVSARKDIGSGRRPDSVEFSSLFDDASRRDLTINSIYYDLSTGNFIDYFNGIDDIRNNVIRTVGNAVDRFNEDPLRKLRAIRFAGRMDSEMSSDIITALRSDNSLVGVSPERIRDEFIKALKTSKNVIETVSLFDMFLFLTQSIFPTLAVNIDRVRCGTDYRVVIATMLRDNDINKIKKVLNKLTYTSNEIKDIVFLLKLTTFVPEDIILIDRLKNQSSLTKTDAQWFIYGLDMDTKFVSALFRYEYNPPELDLPKGKEYGMKLKEIESEKFRQILN